MDDKTPQTPESAPEPATTQPPVVPTTTPQPTAPSAPYVTTPPVKNNKTLGIVFGVIILLIIAAIVFGIALSGRDKSNDSSNSSNSSSSEQKSDEDALREANTVTATSINSFSTVCENGAVGNAADYAEPYKVAAFYTGNRGNSYSSLSLAYDSPYAANSEEFTTTNVVICLDRDDSASVKANTCEFTSATVDYYATKYTAVAREAKTGKKIKELGTVNGPATSCPSFVVYDRNDPKIYGRPDSAAVDALVADL